MSDGKPAFLNQELSKRTPIFGLRLWVVLGICVGAAVVLLLFLISLWFTSRKSRKSSLLYINNKNSPAVSREIQEIRIDPPRKPDPAPESEIKKPVQNPNCDGGGPEVSHLGWGHWYTLRELEASTNEFADENVIGEGGYGIVYKGVLEGNHMVAVKNLLNNRFFPSPNLIKIEFLDSVLLILIICAVLFEGGKQRESLRLKWKQLGA